MEEREEMGKVVETERMLWNRAVQKIIHTSLIPGGLELADLAQNLDLYRFLFNRMPKINGKEK